MSDDNSLVNSENVKKLKKNKNGINIPHDTGLQNLPSWNSIMTSSHPPPSLSIPNLGSATQPQNETSGINNPQKKIEEMPEKNHTINNLENEVKELKMKYELLEEKYKTDTINYESINQGNQEQLRKKDEEQRQLKSLVIELRMATEENECAKWQLVKLEQSKIKAMTKELEEKDKKIAELEELNSVFKFKFEECVKEKDEYQKNYESSIKEIEELKNASIYEENELKKNPATKFKQGKDTSLECTQGIASMSSMVQRNKDGDIDKSEFDIKARTTEDKPTEKCSENPVIKFKQGKEISWISDQQFASISSRISKDGDIGKSEFAMKGKTRQDKPEEIAEAAQECSVPAAETQGSASDD